MRETQRNLILKGGGSRKGKVSSKSCHVGINCCNFYFESFHLHSHSCFFQNIIDARGQRPEARGQRPEARGQRPEARCLMLDARC
jgi:hypothetical protein